MRGWLLDTNVVAALINPQGAPSVKRWAERQDEETFHISVLTLAEYDKGIHNLAADHAERPRYIAARDALAERFGRRVLSLGDTIVRRWGRISGEVKRVSGHAPPVIDTMLAASALEHDLYLVTRNVKDARSSGAIVFDPWNDDAQMFPLSPLSGRER
ncbi:MAG: type II toxin-antitoxin system VapC family toxin [Mesorhizobium sp.]|uniref:type II toxin-antitoxin system VapC family toxin n=1 Tax=Mesorhizobium sp. TaxID=1871066 RepID=UPI000FE982FA|nr:MAG: type II toxin-antitoxin system VapC family toxin [Mesorhizobium sp.]TIT97801.1 MAG: type II toxin-antitoxin system VapC family toxin [Mesorhizobium sp.]TIV64569.1 MAG: type II toxin-antitoxin system VapC family toxin [Mesorhizobium sp.]